MSGKLRTRATETERDTGGRHTRGVRRRFGAARRRCQSFPLPPSCTRLLPATTTARREREREREWRGYWRTRARRRIRDDYGSVVVVVVRVIASHQRESRRADCPPRRLATEPRREDIMERRLTTYGRSDTWQAEPQASASHEEATTVSESSLAFAVANHGSSFTLIFFIGCIRFSDTWSKDPHDRLKILTNF